MIADDLTTWTADDLATERRACSAAVIPGIDTAGNRYWINRRANIDGELNRRAAAPLTPATCPDPDPDRCDACGALALCDCAVYLA